METLPTQIILASSSPRRRQLLEMAEIPHQTLVSGTDETFPSNLSPVQAACHVAAAKAEAVMQSTFYINEGNSSIVLAADTMVFLDDELLAKPTDRSEAIRMLSLLSGRDHRVITGVCIRNTQKCSLFHEETIVSFNPLSLTQIEHYVDTYAPYDKAGAYAIQEWIGLVGISGIRGDYYNVMGLPVSRILQVLQVDFHWK